MTCCVCSTYNTEHVLFAGSHRCVTCPPGFVVGSSHSTDKVLVPPHHCTMVWRCARSIIYTIRSVARDWWRDWKAECGVVIYPSVSTTRTSECVVVIYRYIKYKNYTTCFFENSSTATTPVVYSSFTFLNIPRGFKSCNSGGKRLSGQS